MSTIKPFPELAAYAEAEARAFNDHQVLRWTEKGVASATETITRLLCDLTRDASYDAVVRLAAARLGVPASAVHQAVEDAGGAAWPLLPAPLRGVLDTTFDNPACLAAIVAWLWRDEG